jgi:hypothetical protein
MRPIGKVTYFGRWPLLTERQLEFRGIRQGKVQILKVLRNQISNLALETRKSLSRPLHDLTPLGF